MGEALQQWHHTRLQRPVCHAPAAEGDSLFGLNLCTSQRKVVILGGVAARMTIFGKLLILPFVLLSAAVWAVVGLVFWIPLLAKSVTIFTFTILSHAIVGRSIDHSAEYLKKSITYYLNGFVIILGILWEKVDSDKSKLMDSDVDIGFLSSLISNISKIFGMVLFAAIFWASLFLFINHFGLIEINAVESAKSWLLNMFRGDSIQRFIPRN